MTKHPFIFSFPRSGLHLTAKIIGWPLHVNFDGMDNFMYLDEQINKHTKEILFTHQTYNMINKQSLQSILNKCLPIFIIRDPKDALLSWYFLECKNIETNDTNISRNIRTFAWSSFLQYPNRILLWKEQISDYKIYHKDSLVIRYENLIRAYDYESQKISKYLGFSMSPLLPTIDSVEMSRKGNIGDHRLYFDSNLIEEINEICKEEIEYINTLLV